MDDFNLNGGGLSPPEGSLGGESKPFENVINAVTSALCVYNIVSKYFLHLDSNCAPHTPATRQKMFHVGTEKINKDDRWHDTR